MFLVCDYGTFLSNSLLCAYSTGHFVLHDFLSTLMLVDTLCTQRALKCKKMCNTDDVIKCRKYATQMKSSYGREAQNDQSNRRFVYAYGFLAYKGLKGRCIIGDLS